MAREQEAARLNRARQVTDAVAAVPPTEDLPPTIVDQARSALRDMRALYEEIIADADRRSAKARRARDALATLLYARADLTVGSISHDAGISETQVRRTAERGGATKRRPRKKPPGAHTETPHTVADMADTGVAHPARVYDYLLGGRHHFEIDRTVAEEVMKTYPQMRLMAQQNRAFLVRAVRCCVRAGITQFLDLGSGIPAQGNVHEIAHDINPAARVVYVDHDPVALTIGWRLLAETPYASMIQGDIREIDAILDHEQTRKLIDWSRPVAVLMVAVLHYVPGHEAYDAVAAVRTRMVPGSLLVISHQADHPFVGEARRATHGAVPFSGRTVEQIARFFDGMDLVPPGLVPAPQWRPDTPRIAEAMSPDDIWAYAGVARQPAT